MASFPSEFRKRTSRKRSEIFRNISRNAQKYSGNSKKFSEKLGRNLPKFNRNLANGRRIGVKLSRNFAQGNTVKGPKRTARDYKTVMKQPDHTRPNHSTHMEHVHHQSGATGHAHQAHAQSRAVVVECRFEIFNYCSRPFYEEGPPMVAERLADNQLPRLRGVSPKEASNKSGISCLISSASEGRARTPW